VNSPKRLSSGSKWFKDKTQSLMVVPLWFALFMQLKHSMLYQHADICLRRLVRPVNGKRNFPTCGNSNFPTLLGIGVVGMT
jgi:hypothetical protein